MTGGWRLMTQRLKRPRFVPFMARLALKFIGPKKKKVCA